MTLFSALFAYFAMGKDGVSDYLTIVRQAFPSETECEISEKSEKSSAGQDPARQWVHSYTAPAEPSKPPAAWDGIMPTDCGLPAICRVLGQCPHFTDHFVCWKAANQEVVA